MSDLIFPTEPGIWFGVKKRPIWNTIIKRSATGVEYRWKYYSSPLWEFEFSWDCLRNADIEVLLGFFNRLGGAWNDFYLRDLLNPLVGQVVGTGNGSQTQFQLSRVFNWWYTEYPQFPPFITGYGEGGHDDAGEGYGVPIWETPYLHLDGVQIDEGYEISQTGLITFATPPVTAADGITANWNMYYRARFKEDFIDPEYYRYNLWKLGGVTLVTVR